METRDVRTIDVPHGFLVLDHVVKVSMSSPERATPDHPWGCSWFSVDVETDSGARIHVRSFLVDYQPGDRIGFDCPAQDAARSEAEEFVAELRYCIENP